MSPLEAKFHATAACIVVQVKPTGQWTAKRTGEAPRSFLGGASRRAFFADGMEMERGQALLAPAAAEFPGRLRPHCPVAAAHQCVASGRHHRPLAVSLRYYAEPELPYPKASYPISDGGPTSAQVAMGTSPMRSPECSLLT